MIIDPSFYKQFETSIKNYFSKLDFTPVLPEIADLMDYAITQQFNTQGKYFGTPWAKLAPSTLKARKKKGKTGKIMQVSGVLFDSVFGQVVGGGQVQAGVSMLYGTYLHYGTKSMPPRPILPTMGLPAETLEEMSMIIGEYIMRVSK